MVRAVLDSAKGGARVVRRPWLGASLQAVDGEIAMGLGLERPTGVIVSGVNETGPAADAGLRRGDVILEVDGQPVDNPESFGYRFALKGLSGQTNLTVLRNGQRQTMRVALMPAPETRPRDPVRVRGRTPLTGATLLNMSPAVAEELQLDTSSEGVVVADLDDGAIAGQVGFQKGDQILAIDGRRIASTREVERSLRSGGPYWEITVSRGGRIFTSVLGL
jgi:S1-C subfamily serine protease